MKAACLSELMGLAFLCLVTCSVNARTWHIRPDGTGDAPTVQAGIDSSVAGDTVLVSCGTYYEHDLVMKSGVCLKGENSMPQCVTIDAQQKGILVDCTRNGSSTLIEDLMMINASSYGMICSGFSEIDGPTVQNCVFVHNLNPAVTAMASTPNFNNCVFYGNYGSAGTIVSVYAGSEPLISNCTFVNNSTAIAVGMEGTASVENCVIAYCKRFSLASCDEMSWYSLSCCDLYANANAKYDSTLVDLFPSCFIADPQFCGVSGSNNYYLQSDSPCAPGNHPGGNDCGLIGALPVNCGTTDVQIKTFGAIKALYDS